MDGYGFSAHTATAKPHLVSSLHYPLLGYPSPFLLMGPAARNLHLQCSLLVCVKWESGNCNKYDCIHLLDAWSLLIWGSPGKTWVCYQERTHISKVKKYFHRAWSDGSAVQSYSHEDQS